MAGSEKLLLLRSFCYESFRFLIKFSNCFNLSNVSEIFYGSRARTGADGLSLRCVIPLEGSNKRLFTLGEASLDVIDIELYRS